MEIIQGVFTSLKRILTNSVNIVVFQGEKVDLHTIKIVIRNDLDPVVIEIKCPLALRPLNRWQLRKAFVATVDDVLIPVTLAGQGQRTVLWRMRSQCQNGLYTDSGKQQ